MESSNIPPFRIGDRVVYITGIEMPKGSIHTVKGLTRYPCGCWIVDIGMIGTYLDAVECSNHDGSELEINSCVMYFASASFRPIQQQRFPLMSFSEIVQREFETEKEPQILLDN